MDILQGSNGVYSQFVQCTGCLKNVPKIDATQKFRVVDTNNFRKVFVRTYFCRFCTSPKKTEGDCKAQCYNCREGDAPNKKPKYIIKDKFEQEPGISNFNRPKIVLKVQLCRYCDVGGKFIRKQIKERRKNQRMNIV